MGHPPAREKLPHSGADSNTFAGRVQQRNFSSLGGRFSFCSTLSEVNGEIRKLKRGSPLFEARTSEGLEQMRNQLSTETETRMLSVITFFCYAASVAALICLGHSLIDVALNFAGQNIVAIYSPYVL